MNNNKRIKHESSLGIAGSKINCYVLEDGTRVFGELEVARLFLIEDFEINCAVCDDKIPKIDRMLNKLKTENYKVFDALMSKIEKGLKFICGSCEDKID